MKVFIPRAANMLRKMYLGPWIYGNPKWRWANEDGVSWLFGRDYKYDIIEGGVANDRVIDTVEAFKAGQISEEKALKELSKHQPNNQICILKQAVADKYFKFVRSVILK